MLMSKAIVLDNVEHKNVKVDTRSELNKNVNRTLVYATEISDLHKEFPLVFYKQPESDKIQLHAILGLEKDENLFVDENGWITRFIPALLARGPFSLLYNEAEKDSNKPQDPLICIDMEDPRINTEHGEDVFLQFGGDAPYLNYVKKALKTIESGIQFDKTLFSLIESMDLLKPVAINIKLSNIQGFTFSDYYAVNQEKLSKLDGDSLAKLSQYGILSLLYFVLSSMGNFQSLMDLKNAKSAMC